LVERDLHVPVHLSETFILETYMELKVQRPRITKKAS
jgi:hypothetical protein